jgi:Uma2 family endonuclease
MSVLTVRKAAGRRPSARAIIPPPVAGDHLDLAEFWRRCEAHPEIKKAELLDGVVFMPPPVYDDHSVPDNAASGWLAYYAARTPGTCAHNDRSLQLIGISAVQPDVCLVLLPECGGRTFVNEEQKLAGSPELIFEVAASSTSYDLFEKKDAYHANQVREYLVWQTLDQRFDWFEWTPAEYIRRRPDAKGILRSKTFPGLWLNVRALLDLRFDTVMETLERGVRSPEHKRFVAALRAKLKPARKHR